MRKSLLLVSLFVCAAMAQVDNNWNGWGDTSQVSGFKGTGTVYGKPFRLSAMENFVIDVYAQDSANKAGAITDQDINFEWGIEFMHPTWTSNTARNVYKYSEKLVIDTLNLAGSGVFAKTKMFLASDGSYDMQKLLVDTSSISKWAAQSRAFSPQWDVYCRPYATGISGNQATTYVKLVFQQVRRKLVKVGN